MTDTTVNNLIINKLTKAQYSNIQSPSNTELYLVPDEIDNVPTSGSDNPVKSGGIYTSLQGKADLVSSATNGNFAALNSSGNLTDSGKNASDFPKKIVTSNINWLSSSVIDELNVGDVVAEESFYVQLGESEYLYTVALKENNANGYRCCLVRFSESKMYVVYYRHSTYEWDYDTTVEYNLNDYVQKSLTAGLLKNDGTVDTNTYLTSHQDISGKENRTAIVAASGTTLNASVGNYYRFDAAVGTLAITLNHTSDAYVQQITFGFTTDTTTNVTFTTATNGETIYYDLGSSIEASKTYEVNAMWNGASWMIACMNLIPSI